MRSFQTDSKVIAAFDLATTTGICWGPIGGRPSFMTIDATIGGASRGARLSFLLSMFRTFFNTTHVDMVRYEQPLEVTVAAKVGTSNDTITMLHGAVAILEVAAYRAGIADVSGFAVQSARMHLTGQRTHGGRAAGKAAVMRVCQMLRVRVKNDNEADAYAGWSYCCGLANPRLAIAVTPLFARSGSLAGSHR